ncbi:MAG: uracil-DNA glycosylase [Bacteriovoracaceae bacterium]
MSKQKDCMNCKHFYVTWDPKFPRGCRAYEVKTANSPWQVVAQATSEGCVQFEAKKDRNAEQKKGLDLNRNDLW